MHFPDNTTPDPEEGTQAQANQAMPWWKELNRYHWFVFVVASLGWLFDTMDQQLFVVARTPALKELLPPGSSVEDYGGKATAIFMIGWATGGLVFGWLGDRVGRARTMMLTILTYSVFTGLSALSRNWLEFAFYRFITGMGVGGEFAAGVSLVAEVMPSRARPYALGLLQALSAIGNMTAAGVSLLLPPQMTLQVFGGMEFSGWRALFLVGIIPALLVVVIFSKLQEPESWRKARRDPLHRQGDLRELFGEARWRHHTLVGVVLATAGVMGLWGIGFWTPELVRNNVLKGFDKTVQDRYASYTLLLQNLGGFFGVYAFAWLTGRTGRRPAFAISYLLALGATVLVFGFMTEPSQIWWMIPLLGFCGLMVFGGFAIYFPELYPTRLRATGTGFCYNVARYLAAFAPFMLGKLTLLYLAPEGTERASEKLSSLTWLSSVGSVDNAFRYAALTVASVFLLGLLVLPAAPETRGKPLPE